MQFRSHSLPVHQSMSVSWAFTLSHFVSQIRLRDFFRLLAIGMCHFLPVHHFEMACLAGSKVKIQKKTTTERLKTSTSTCNPTNNTTVGIKETSPLPGNCLQKNVKYRTTVKTNYSVKQCIGSTEGTIIQGIYNNKLFLIKRNYSTNTALSIRIWYLKT